MCEPAWDLAWPQVSRSQTPRVLVWVFQQQQQQQHNNNNTNTNTNNDNNNNNNNNGGMGFIPERLLMKQMPLTPKSMPPAGDKHASNINNNNNRRLVTLAEHTSDHGRQTNSSTEEKGEQV